MTDTTEQEAATGDALSRLRDLRRQLAEFSALDQTAHPDERTRRTQEISRVMLETARLCADHTEEALKEGADFVRSQIEVFGTSGSVDEGDARRLARLALDERLRVSHPDLVSLARSLLRVVRRRHAVTYDPLSVIELPCRVEFGGATLAFQHPIPALRWLAHSERETGVQGSVSLEPPAVPPGPRGAV